MPRWPNRDFGKRYGDDIKARAFEELIAEMGSVQCAMETGLPSQIDNHASYIEHWLTVLKSAKKALFIAAAKSSQAVDYVMGRPGYEAKQQAKTNKDAVSDTKAKTTVETPKPEAKTPPSLPAEIAKPATEALAAVSEKMKKMRERRKSSEAPPPSLGGMRM